MLYIPSPHACEFLFTLNNLLCLSEFSMWYVLLLLDASPLPDLYVDSFHLSILKHLISWNITILQVFLTILRFSFFYFYIRLCELLQCVFVHCCCWLVAVFALFCTSILLYVWRDSKGQDLPPHFKFNEHTRTSKYYFYNVWRSCLTQLLETTSTGM